MRTRSKMTSQMDLTFWIELLCLVNFNITQEGKKEKKFIVRLFSLLSCNWKEGCPAQWHSMFFLPHPLNLANWLFGNQIKGFIRFFDRFITFKLCFAVEDLKIKQVSVCTLFTLCHFMQIMWFFRNYVIKCDLRSIIRARN